MSSDSSEPRDFLERASSYLQTPAPLAIMLQENKPQVMSKLLEVLRSGGVQERKQTAFALGQIGDTDVIPHLKNALQIERIEGVREAMEASLGALVRTPAEKGFSELDRRRMIDDVYYGRQPRLSGWERS